LYLGLGYAQTTGPETTAQTRPAATQPLPALTGLYAPADSYFAIRYPAGLKAQPGPGFVQFDHPDGMLRIYSIGLRAVGGKYRNAEHALDDCVFQIRDELKGRVEPKSSVKWQAGEQNLTARKFAGIYQDGDQAQRIICMIVPHTTPGYVLSIQMVSSPGHYEAGEALLKQMLDTLELRTVKPAATTAPAK
jgi:hypothetical protein